MTHSGEYEHPFCSGESLCDGCGWCPDCERFVGEPHVAVCACPPDQKHLLCPSCHAKFVAWALTRGEHDTGHWWDEVVTEHARRTQGERADPAKWLVYIGADGVTCGGCRLVLIEARQRDGSAAIPTSSELVLHAVTRHLPECGRAMEIDARRFGRGSSFGTAEAAVSGSSEQDQT